MANATGQGNDIDVCIDSIVDTFQSNGSTSTTTYQVLWNAIGFNVSSVFTAAAAAQLGTSFGTLTNTYGTGSQGRSAGMRALIKEGFIALINSDPGTTQIQSFSAGATTTWNTCAVTITRL